MALGVAMANAILLVSFAQSHRLEGRSIAQAASLALGQRIRPILMTSFAMIAGMTPMALGLGEGGDQTSPLARSVIGGLAASTIASLLVLPGLFALFTGYSTMKSPSLDPFDPLSSHHLPPPDPTTGAMKS
jgi:multidrug efflux pump subunit AcrB